MEHVRLCVHAYQMCACIYLYISHIQKHVQFARVKIVHILIDAHEIG